MADDLYYIWSNQHKGWWGPDHCGYYRRIANAGRYTEAEATRIAFSALPRKPGIPFNELPVKCQHVDDMLAKFRTVYPEVDPEQEEKP
jgi:hypothetical protein